MSKIKVAAILASALLASGCANSTDGTPSGPSTTDQTANTQTNRADQARSELSPREQLQAWFNKGPRDALAAITTDTSDISTAASNYDIGAVIAGCSALKTDVVTFQSQPGAPDATMRADLARAMDYYSTAASECIDGDFDSSANDISSGTVYIKKATARVDELLGN